MLLQRHWRAVAEITKNSIDHPPAYYKLEASRSDLDIANHRLTRFDYTSPEAGLHWRILTAEVRCHAVQFLADAS